MRRLQPILIAVLVITTIAGLVLATNAQIALTSKSHELATAQYANFYAQVEVRSTASAGAITQYGIVTAQYETLIAQSARITDLSKATSTPTLTPSPTPTPTPFNTSVCVDLKITASLSDPKYRELLIAQRNTFGSKCVRLIFIPENGYFSPSSMDPVFDISANSSYGRLVIRRDDKTPVNLINPTKLSFIWGVFNPPDTFYLRKVEELSPDQYPIESRLFAVGSDRLISPGLWTSPAASPLGTSCYWARIDPKTGDVIKNYFGPTGVQVSVSAGEFFETTGCGKWYFVGP